MGGSGGQVKGGGAIVVTSPVGVAGEVGCPLEQESAMALACWCESSGRASLTMAYMRSSSRISRKSRSSSCAEGAEEVAAADEINVAAGGAAADAADTSAAPAETTAEPAAAGVAAATGARAAAAGAGEKRGTGSHSICGSSGFCTASAGRTAGTRAARRNPRQRTISSWSPF